MLWVEPLPLPLLANSLLSIEIVPVPATAGVPARMPSWLPWI